MTAANPTKLEQAERTLRWSVRSCVIGPVLAGIAFVLAVLDFGGRDETILSAVTLAVCFVATFFGLAGLFGLALARETAGLRPAPKFAVPCGVGAILGSFAAGLFGLVT